MTAPGWQAAETAVREALSRLGIATDLPVSAVVSAARALSESPLARGLDLTGWEMTAAAVALEAGQAAIRADADSRRIPGSEMYMAGAAAERERIRQLATERGAVYCARERVSGRCTCLSGRAEAVPFADLIEGDDQ